MTTTTRTSETGALPVPAASLARLFHDRVAASGSAEAFRHPDGDGGWTSVTWAQAGETVTVTAAGLLALGIRPEDRVAVASGTRMEWVYADLAVMCAGGATTAVYPTTSTADVGFILSDSGARIVFAEDDAQVAKLRSQRDHLPDVVRVVTFDGEPDGEWVISLADLQALGASLLVSDPTAVDEAVAAIRPEHLATLIYTSGTTGRPKGVELPHRCWTYIGAAAESVHLVRPDDLQYLWLPMAHSFGKMLEAVQLQIGFPTAIDGRLDRIVDNLAVVRPTFMAGPPRIFEKVHGRVVQTVEQEGGIKLRLFSWAFATGAEVWRAHLEGRRPSPWLRAQHLVADRLVLSKVRDRLGGRIRFLLSGSAALSSDIADWFGAAGMPVVEGYGLTETSGGATVADLDRPGAGVVGAPLLGSEIRIAEDGEILIRGPHVMRGYHNRADATAEVLAPDGWFSTGDVGELDREGRLRVTDRKKDLIKTSGGKYIAPQAIEGLFKAVCPLASQMIVHGDGRNYATAIITLDPDALVQWAKAQGLTSTDYASLVTEPAVVSYVQECLDEMNARLNRWETIKDFRLLDHDMSVESEELTPSMKVKRRQIETRYRSLLDSMYEGAADSDV
ncbi:long-chain acyl-CoA synthetase [Blastococcus aggregatus]|uniref:Long-chain acyl-CoA synthetase n=1 Tax=Blastococcus aggregatus TaxID=38502 RepID=A0A285V6C4_9ACTN|nr:long-chain fatty acid--CoA ligase [Blastococcus aggregatus]SOC49563.1 long-chain acyl-CoA synthetase [Blastococcus aggregatus]